MDELFFHFGRSLELFQLWLYELSHKTIQMTSELEDSLLIYLSSPGYLSLKSAVNGVYRSAIETSANVASKVASIADPDFIHNLFLRYCGHDLNRATLFACCIGFTLGSSVGLVIGICLQSPKPPSVLMRAVASTSYEGEIVLLEDAFVPKMYKCDQVIVEVKFAAIDTLDVRISLGYGKKLRDLISRYNPNIHCDLPLVIGRQGSGIVVETGSKVENVEVGNHVYFCTDFIRNGSLAEYVLLDSADVAKIPKSIGFEGAASLPESAVLAWNAVVAKAKLTSRTAHTKKIFVHCGSTGAGWMVVQLCAAFGAQVSSSAVSDAKSALKAVGAFTVFTVESGEMSKNRTKYDFVFNTVGPVANDFCCELCLPRGQVIDVYQRKVMSDGLGILFGNVYALWIRITYGIFGAETWRESGGNGKTLDEISKLIDRRLIQPFVDRTYYPEELDDAINNSETSFGTTLIRFENRRVNGFRGSRT